MINKHAEEENGSITIGGDCTGNINTANGSTQIFRRRRQSVWQSVALPVIVLASFLLLVYVILALISSSK